MRQMVKKCRQRVKKASNATQLAQSLKADELISVSQLIVANPDSFLEVTEHGALNPGSL